jgi:hypothetical protein
MKEENISPQRREGAKGREVERRRLSLGLFSSYRLSSRDSCFFSLSFAHLCAFAPLR